MTSVLKNTRPLTGYTILIGPTSWNEDKVVATALWVEEAAMRILWLTTYVLSLWLSEKPRYSQGSSINRTFVESTGCFLQIGPAWVPLEWFSSSLLKWLAHHLKYSTSCSTSFGLPKVWQPLEFCSKKEWRNYQAPSGLSHLARELCLGLAVTLNLFLNSFSL